jgi:hypothetical protein
LTEGTVVGIDDLHTVACSNGTVEITTGGGVNEAGGLSFLPVLVHNLQHAESQPPCFTVSFSVASDAQRVSLRSALVKDQFPTVEMERFTSQRLLPLRMGDATTSLTSPETITFIVKNASSVNVTIAVDDSVASVWSLSYQITPECPTPSFMQCSAQTSQCFPTSSLDGCLDDRLWCEETDRPTYRDATQRCAFAPCVALNCSTRDSDRCRDCVADSACAYCDDQLGRSACMGLEDSCSSSNGFSLDVVRVTHATVGRECPDPCQAFDECDACATAEFAALGVQCGFCKATGACLTGDAFGPSLEWGYTRCRGDWKFGSAEERRAGTKICDRAQCRDFSECDDCADVPQCTWCSLSGKGGEQTPHLGQCVELAEGEDCPTGFGGGVFTSPETCPRQLGACPADVFVCETGKHLERDPENACAFPHCPTPAAGVSAVLGIFLFLVGSSVLLVAYLVMRRRAAHPDQPFFTWSRRQQYQQFDSL